jgi:NDP-sugar pyrophosphorylase family protein
MQMKAMIFAAGLGTRLQSITQNLPKALVMVAGLPLLEHCLKTLNAQGFDKIVINVHHFADRIEAYLCERPDSGQRILISDERSALLETGGGLRKAAPLLLHGFDSNDENDPILLHNVDIFSNVDLNEMMKYHLYNHADATLAVNKRASSRYLYFDQKTRLQGWQHQISGEQKPRLFDAAKYNPMAFSGIHIVSPSLILQMQNWPDRFSIMDFYLSTMDNYYYQAFTQSNMQVLDVGRPEAIEQAPHFFDQLF